MRVMGDADRSHDVSWSPQLSPQSMPRRAQSRPRIPEGVVRMWPVGWERTGARCLERDGEAMHGARIVPLVLGRAK